MAPKQPLSRDRIVDAAVRILDASGESGLTFRALTAELETGPGAVYWHVANKDELLIAATSAVLAPATAEPAGDQGPEDAIRAIAFAVFDATDAHPWIGSELTRVPLPPAILRILELIGRRIDALGVPTKDQFTVATTVFNYILGVAAQNAALDRRVQPGTNRPEFLGAMAAQWKELDPEEFSFLPTIAEDVGDHDDREQFRLGVDLILAGVVGRWRPADD